MKLIIVLAILALCGCERHPPPLNEPAANAPVWDLNGDQLTQQQQQGTNDLRQKPTVGDR